MGDRILTETFQQATMEGQPAVGVVPGVKPEGKGLQRNSNTLLSRANTKRKEGYNEEGV